jgi:two-component system cell cycle response regulator DivK
LAALHGVDFTGPSRGEPLVLVVHDSPDERKATGQVLELDGLRVITVSNGLEAVLATHSARPAVVGMDVQMSIIDGVEAAPLLKADAATRLVPLIAHTSAADIGNEAASMMFDVILP